MARWADRKGAFSFSLHKNDRIDSISCLSPVLVAASLKMLLTSKKVRPRPPPPHHGSSPTRRGLTNATEPPRRRPSTSSSSYMRDSFNSRHRSSFRKKQIATRPSGQRWIPAPALCQRGRGSRDASRTSFPLCLVSYFCLTEDFLHSISYFSFVWYRLWISCFSH